MATILTKKKDTTGAPVAGDLTNSSGGAELAVNTADKRLYTKDSGGNVVEVGTNPGTAVTFTAGTVSAPAITTTGDTNTGVFFPAADTIAFAEGGAEAMRINSDSQVVTTAGTASLPAITTTGDVNTGIFFPAADTIAFAEGGAEAMRIDSSGNVGIGQTSPGTVGVANYRNLVIGNSSVAAAGITFSTNGSAGTAPGLAFARDGGGVNGYLRYDQSVGAMTFGTEAAERMRIDSSGNVLVTGAGGLGYGTGSGGAVTQGTSRTTGVTLDKTNGAITLVSAAGTTTWQTFTVTNNKVAATDTVVVCQKSGTDLYEIHVTAVAAGSFNISYRTTGGTTTEQPVFNFAVIKAVTS